eukprot:4047414-Pyramimonas_sp.AAC.1
MGRCEVFTLLILRRRPRSRARRRCGIVALPSVVTDAQLASASPAPGELARTAGQAIAIAAHLAQEFSALPVFGLDA